MIVRVDDKIQSRKRCELSAVEIAVLGSDIRAGLGCLKWNLGRVCGA